MLTVKDLIENLKEYNENDIVVIGNSEDDYESISRLAFTEPTRVFGSEIVFDAEMKYNAVYLGTEDE